MTSPRDVLYKSRHVILLLRDAKAAIESFETSRTRYCRAQGPIVLRSSRTRK